MDFFTIVDPETGAPHDAIASVAEVIVVSSVVIIGSVLVQILPELYALGSRALRPRRSTAAATSLAATGNAEQAGVLRELPSTMTNKKKGSIGPVSKADANHPPEANTQEKAAEPVPAASAAGALQHESAPSLEREQSSMRKGKGETSSSSNSTSSSDPRPREETLEKALDEFLAAEDLLDEAISDIVITAAAAGVNASLAPSTVKKTSDASAAAKPIVSVPPPGIGNDVEAKEAADREKAVAQRMVKGLFTAPLPSSVKGTPAATAAARQQQEAPQGVRKETLKGPAPIDETKGTPEKNADASAGPITKNSERGDDEAMLDDALDVVSPTKAQPDLKKHHETSSAQAKDSMRVDDVVNPVSPTKPQEKAAAVHRATRQPAGELLLRTTAPQAKEPPPPKAAAAAATAVEPDLLDAAFDEVHEQHQCIDDAILDALILK
jgi:hypothetical protein